MTTTLLHLAAAVALLLWALALLGQSALRAGAGPLAQALPRPQPLALLAGLAAGCAAPSALVLQRAIGPLLEARVLRAPAALLALAGADLGAALATLAAIASPAWALPLLMLAGVAAAARARRHMARQAAQAVLAAAFVLLACMLLEGVFAALAQAELLRLLLQPLQDDLLLAATLGLASALAARSATAAVLVAAGAVTAGALPLAVGLAFTFGANLAAAVLCLVATRAAPPAVVRAAAGALLLKAGSLAALAFALWGWRGAPVATAWPPGLVLAAVHLLAGALPALLAASLAGPVATLCEGWLPDRGDDAGPAPARLDPEAVATTSVALSAATREVARLADRVEAMLHRMREAILAASPEQAMSARDMDDEVDRSYAALKRYLTTVRQRRLSAQERGRWDALMAMTICLEQVADAASRALHDFSDHASDKPRRLPKVALLELATLHERLIANLRLAVNLLLHRQGSAAPDLKSAGAAFLDLERDLTGRHLDRLAGGDPESIATSAVYLDLLADLERMNSLVCFFAHGLQPARAGGPTLADAGMTTAGRQLT